jgi:hypothetical protein
MKFNPETLFALLIGIDEYESIKIPNLYGAVSDAQEMDSYLKGIGVPEENVHTLLNAKRKDILDAFMSLTKGHLANAKPIPCGSALLIFYAGHGGRTDIPKEWKDYVTTDGKVEQIVPVDTWATDPEDEGKVVEGIPDRTIAVVLNLIAQKIGNNVVSK